ncbi:hypothetical protein RYH73_03360 [Olivibacter sp. CPCC 100613]|uniref:hypothetical protein n=1 Tax=Olivibacter sp. CPCC 100613 TaxID=3079931 RepID=UPI002FF5A385
MNKSKKYIVRIQIPSSKLVFDTTDYGFEEIVLDNEMSDSAIAVQLLYMYNVEIGEGPKERFLCIKDPNEKCKFFLLTRFWNTFKEEWKSKKVFDLEGKEVGNENIDKYLSVFHKSFVSGYHDFEDSLVKKASIFKNDINYLSEKIIKFIDSYESAIYSPFAIIDDKHVLLNEHINMLGKLAGNYYKAWHIIVNNPEKFIDILIGNKLNQYRYFVLYKFMKDNGDVQLGNSGVNFEYFAKRLKDILLPFLEPSRGDQIQLLDSITLLSLKKELDGVLWEDGITEEDFIKYWTIGKTSSKLPLVGTKRDFVFVLMELGLIGENKKIKKVNDEIMGDHFGISSISTEIKRVRENIAKNGSFYKKYKGKIPKALFS